MKKILSIFLIMISMLFLVGCDFITTKPNTSDNDTTTVEDDTIKDKFILADEYKDCEFDTLPDDYKIVFCDEFNYTGMLDSTKWTYEIGNGSGGWGNNELEYYTNRSDNSYVSDGCLTITAKKESYGGCSYTSARVTTKNKFEFTYGYIEVRAMMPTGYGTWPAIWMMPTDSVYGTWPNSGEMDILETTGRNANTAYATIHTGAFNHSIGTQKGSTKYVQAMQTAYQIYGLRWSEDKLEFSVNGTVYFTFNYLDGWKDLSTTDRAKFWPFDQNFFLILNVAMGGSWGGTVDSAFTSSEMKVDYVRIYQKGDSTDNEAPDKAVIDDCYASSSTINLTWTKPTDNVGVRYYKVVLDNDIYAATTKEKYTITGLNPNTIYTLRIMAVDWNDNYSISEKFKIRTSEGIILPSTFDAYHFDNATDYSLVSGNDGILKTMLELSGSGTAIYQISSPTNETYNLSIRASILRQTTISIYEVINGVETLVSSSDLSQTYGSYKTFDLGDINIKEGISSIKVVISGATDIYYIIINSLSFTNK